MTVKVLMCSLVNIVHWAAKYWKSNCHNISEVTMYGRRIISGGLSVFRMTEHINKDKVV